MSQEQDLLDEINSEFGANTAIILNDASPLKVDVIPTGISVVDNAIGVGGIPRGKITEVFGAEGCISGDSFISYSVGKNKKGGSIKRLYERFHNKNVKGRGKNNKKQLKESRYYTLAADENGMIVSTEIMDVVFNGIKTVFEVTTESGKKIKTTDNHPFLTPHGYTWLKNLSIGDVVLVHNKTRIRGKTTRPYRKEVLVKYHPFGTIKQVGKYLYYRKKEYQLTFEARVNGMTLEDYIKFLNTSSMLEINKLSHIPKGYDIHHKDGDITNNSPENLILISLEEHARLHAIDNQNLNFIATPEKIISIEKVSEEEVFDLKCLKPNNYIANGFVIHNCGKTSLCLHTIAQAQKMGLTAVFVDAEHSINQDRMEALGVDTGKLILHQPESGEGALDLVEMTVRTNRVGIVVVDSVAALTPQVEIEKDMGDSVMGVHARLLSQAMRKLTAPVSKSNTALMFTNQTRAKLGSFFGGETTTGGNALKFYASLRMKMQYTGQVKDGSGQRISGKYKMTVVKSKLATPFKEALFEINQYGLDDIPSLIDTLEKAGVLGKSGSWYEYGGKNIANGKVNMTEILHKKPELKELLVEALHASLHTQTSRIGS